VQADWKDVRAAVFQRDATVVFLGDTHFRPFLAILLATSAALHAPVVRLVFVLCILLGQLLLVPAMQEYQDDEETDNRHAVQGQRSQCHMRVSLHDGQGNGNGGHLSRLRAAGVALVGASRAGYKDATRAVNQCVTAHSARRDVLGSCHMVVHVVVVVRHGSKTRVSSAAQLVVLVLPVKRKRARGVAYGDGGVLLSMTRRCLN
jgi:hypothetical protein